MITPTEIRKKAQKLWQSGRVLKAALTHEPLFPWLITFRKPTAMQQVKNFAAIRDWIYTLQTQSKTGEEGEIANEVCEGTIASSHCVGVTACIRYFIFFKR